jgi:hypothetical protein
MRCVAIFRRAEVGVGREGGVPVRKKGFKNGLFLELSDRKGATKKASETAPLDSLIL